MTLHRVLFSAVVACFAALATGCCGIHHGYGLHHGYGYDSCGGCQTCEPAYGPHHVAPWYGPIWKHKFHGGWGCQHVGKHDTLHPCEPCDGCANWVGPPGPPIEPACPATIALSPAAARPVAVVAASATRRRSAARRLPTPRRRRRDAWPRRRLHPRNRGTYSVRRVRKPGDRRARCAGRRRLAMCCVRLRHCEGRS